MAFDGLAVAALRNEFENKIKGGRVYKIAQPEPDTLLLTIKNNSDTLRLLISANASFPLIYLTDENRPSPKTAPAFCMLLRKHLQNGRITDVSQPGLERIIEISVEHMDEMGDMRCHRLIAEFMGKHSNIILCDEANVITDSIKRIPASVSSVREVLPGRDYFVPDPGEKLNPFETDEDAFYQKVFRCPTTIQKAIYTNVTGFSPLSSLEICERANMETDRPATSLTLEERRRLYAAFSDIVSALRSNSFDYGIYTDFVKTEFSVISLKNHICKESFETPSEMLIAFYAEKEKDNRIRQKSADLRKLVSVFLERAYKKAAVQEQDIAKTLDREKYKKYGELLQAYGYGVTPGQESITVPDHYDDNKEITIPLKPELTPQENANAYFKRYNKLKRTFDAANEQLEETRAEIAELEGLSYSLEIAENEDDLARIKQELSEAGLIHSKINADKKQKALPPLKFLSSDGFEILVGKNNYQNDEITFKMSEPTDWWFHAKDIAGSHVLMKTRGMKTEDIPDRAFEEAASLAAKYSKGSRGDKVEIDYVQKKEVKKPGGAKPGFVVYYTNYSMMAGTDISSLRQYQ